MSSEICKDLNELHPKVKELAIKLLEECKKAGLNIKISETYRTKERQDYLYAQGRTRSGPIITNAKGSAMSSYHQWRLAFDIYNNVPGYLYNITVLSKAGAIGQKLGLEWGGSWTGFKDMPHFQYTFGLTIADLKSGKQPPEYIQDQNSDETLKKAVQTLSTKGIITKPEAWSTLDEINLINVPILLIKLGGLDRLTELGIISDKLFWQNKKYTTNQVRALIIKAAGRL